MTKAKMKKKKKKTSGKQPSSTPADALVDGAPPPEGTMTPEEAAAMRPRRKLGRPPKTPEVEPPVFNAAILVPVVSLPFDLVAKRKGDHWRLDIAESRALAQTVGAVVNKWLPVVFDRWAEELALGIALLSILTPRIQRDIAAAAAERREAEDAARRDRKAGDGQDNPGGVDRPGQDTPPGG